LGVRDTREADVTQQERLVDRLQHASYALEKIRVRISHPDRPEAWASGDVMMDALKKSLDQLDLDWKQRSDGIPKQAAALLGSAQRALGELQRLFNVHAANERLDAAKARELEETLTADIEKLRSHAMVADLRRS
jgi:hypothetical protein